MADTTTQNPADLMQLDLQRHALHGVHLGLHLDLLKGKMSAFTRGVTRTPWNTSEPRVMGFEREYDEMLAAFVSSEPVLLTREQMSKLNIL